MPKKQPQIQNAITLKKFFVSSVNFKIDNPLNEQTIEKLNIKIGLKVGFTAESLNMFLYLLIFLLTLKIMILK